MTKKWGWMQERLDPNGCAERILQDAEIGLSPGRADAYWLAKKWAAMERSRDMAVIQEMIKTGGVG